MLSSSATIPFFNVYHAAFQKMISVNNTHFRMVFASSFSKEICVVLGLNYPGLYRLPKVSSSTQGRESQVSKNETDLT